MIRHFLRTSNAMCAVVLSVGAWVGAKGIYTVVE